MCEIIREVSRVVLFGDFVGFGIFWVSFRDLYYWVYFFLLVGCF